MPDQTTRINNAVEKAMGEIHARIAAFEDSGFISRSDLLNEIQRRIYAVLQESGIDQTAESAPSAESVGRAMLALPHLAASDVLAVARLIDDARNQLTAEWAKRLDSELAAHTDRAEKAIRAAVEHERQIAHKDGHDQQDQYDDLRRLFGDKVAEIDRNRETITRLATERDSLLTECQDLRSHLDAAKGAQLSDQADRLARAIDRLESGQIGFSEAQRSMVLNAALETGQAADKLAELYQDCKAAVEQAGPMVQPLIDTITQLLTRDMANAQRRVRLQTLGASEAEIDDYESRAFDVAAQVKKLGGPLDYITIAAFDEPEPQEAERPEAKPGSLESRRVQLIELGQKGSDVDRFVADMLDKMIEICAAGYKMKAGNTWPITIPTPEPAGVFNSADVRVALARLIDQWGLNNLANQFNMPPKELQGIVYGDDLIPERIARKAGFESDGQNWRKITYE